MSLNIINQESAHTDMTTVESDQRIFSVEVPYFQSDF